MTIRVRCQGCNTEYALADGMAGKQVRCKKCESVISVTAAPPVDAPAAKRPTAAFASEPLRQDQERRSPARRPDPPRRARDEDDVDAPRIKKSGNMALWLILGGVGVAFLLLLACGGGGVVAMLWVVPVAPSPVAVVSTTSTVVSDKPVPPAANGQPGAAPPAVQPAVGDKPAPPADNAPFHLADVRKSVVFIRRSTPGQPTSTGSGFFVNQDGLIATNRHVVQSEAGPNPATVLYVGVPSAADPDVLDYFKGQVAYCPPAQDTLDFALVKIAARPGYQAFRPLPLGSTKLDLGAPAAAIGFPLTTVDNPVLSFNKGSISATKVAIEDHPYYQTDAAINHGNSGGPLVNADGQAVGIVSRVVEEANNTGFALYLTETGLPAILNQEQIVRVKPEAGPLDPKQLPPSTTLKPTNLASWEITHGEAAEEKGLVIAENRGASFWLTNKTPLPENFQLKIQCFIVPVLPRRDRQGPGPGFGPPIIRPPGFGPPVLPQQQVNMNMLGSLYVRFGTDSTGDDVLSMSGTTVHLSAARLQVADAGVVVATAPKGVPHDPFLLTVTRRGDELTVDVNGEVWTTQKLKGALQGSHKFSIGGFQSALILQAAMASPVDGPPVPPPVAVAPPKPAPTGPPAVLAFDAVGWDKPVDADGDCKVVPNKGALTIEVPAKRHDLSVEQGAMNAPRLLRDVTGDFTAQVQVGGDFQPAAPSTNPAGLPFLGAGLVVTAGDSTCIRLERAAVNRNGQTNAYVNWEVRAVGLSRTGSGALRPNAPGAPLLYLRLRRQGDRFFSSYSGDGATWTEFPAQDVKLPAAVKVGVAAVTTSAEAFKANYDDFRLGASGEAIVAAPPPPADPKIWAAKPPADWKGPEWTADPDKMKAPEGAPSGWLMGAEFKADNVTYNVGMLNLRQGQPGAPGGNILLVLPQKSMNDLEGKTLTVVGKQQFPHVIFGNPTRMTEEKQLKTEPLGEFALKLEFGKVDDGKLPGTIYLCIPDDARSVVAGKFVLEKK